MNKIKPKYTNSELIKKYFEQAELFTDFEGVVNASASYNRELYMGAVSDDMAGGLEAMIRFYNRCDEQDGIPVKERMPIKLFIDSPGGDLTGAYTIINAIELSKTPVWTINIGCAYSAGFFIFIAGHYRIAYPLASFLYHEGSCVMGGDAHKFRNQADFYKKQLDQLKKHTLKYTNLTEEDYEKILKDDYWLTAEEAMEKGIVDEITTVEVL
jgi:ATP-dependent Clp protease protease subunit